MTTPSSTVQAHPECVLHVLSGDLLGGSEAQMIAQLPALRRLGWNVHALVFNEGETAAQLRASGVPVHLCEERKGFFALIRTVRGVLSELAPAAINTHGYKEAIVSALALNPTKSFLIRTYHGLTENYRGLKRIKMALYQIAESVLTTSHVRQHVTVNHSLATALGLVGRSDHSVIYNVARVGNETPDRALFLKRPAVAIVGRLVPVKRVDRAIAAFEEFLRGTEQPNAGLYIIGDGPERPALEGLRERSEFRDQIHFMGFCSDAARRIASADALLMSSDSEGLPTVMLEAMLHNVAIASVDLPGIREMAELFPGYPVHLASPSAQELAAAIHNALPATSHNTVDPDLAARVRHFASPDRAAQDHDQLLRRIIGAERARRS